MVTTFYIAILNYECLILNEIRYKYQVLIGILVVSGMMNDFPKIRCYLGFGKYASLHSRNNYRNS